MSKKTDKPDITFTCDGKAVAAALGRLAATISRKTTLPVLSCAALEIRDGALWASVTNLDQMHRMELPVQIETGKEGAGACAALGMLTGLMGKANGDGVRVALSADWLHVEAAGRKASLAVLPLKEFPEQPVEPLEWETVASAGLARALGGVAFAVSTEETRYILCGVHLSAEGVSVATDGRRLASIEYTHSPAAALAGIVVPTPALSAMVDLLSRHESVEVAGGDGEVRLRASGEEYYTRLIEGIYPNWKQVVPSFVAPQKVSVERDQLKRALSWARLYGKKDQAVRITVSEKGMVIRVTSPDVGEAEECIPTLALWEGPDLQMALNEAYLEQMVSRPGGGDTFHLEVEKTADGGVCTPVMVRGEDEGYLGVIMPIRVAK